MNTCQKCGYELVNDAVLCDICSHYAPKDAKYFKKYVSEKIDGRILDTFRNANLSISERTRAGMMKKQNTGGVISKPPKGYRLVDKRLVVDEIQAGIIKILFNEYLTTESSLTRLSAKYGLSTPGLIKILKNPVYIGMIKLKDTSIKGIHEPIIEKELFEKVQGKMRGK